MLWGNASCGDGFIQTGEECDCGQPDCTGIDPCCNGSTCFLFPGNACSNLFPCCSNCQLIPATPETVCRASIGECDLQEVCNGVDATCPPDWGKGAGNECNDGRGGKGACYAKQCKSHDKQCYEDGQRLLSKPIFVSCPNQISFNLGFFCKTSYCQDVTNTATCQVITNFNGQELLVQDGVPCATGMQCLTSQCVESNDLSDFPYLMSEWTPCFTCADPQYRTVNCSFQGKTVEGIYCSLPIPASQRNCQNETLGCSKYSCFCLFLALMFYVFFSGCD